MDAKDARIVVRYDPIEDDAAVTMVLVFPLTVAEIEDDATPMRAFVFAFTLAVPFATAAPSEDEAAITSTCVAGAEIRINVLSSLTKSPVKVEPQEINDGHTPSTVFGVNV